MVYTDRIGGNRAENLEQAIQSYLAALSVYTFAEFPQDWAMTQNNLGNAYVSRVLGNRAENIERAIHSFEAALQVYEHRAFPEEWARTQNNLGNAYWEKSNDDPDYAIGQAVQAYEAALTVYQPQRFPKETRTVARNLGNVMLDHQDWKGAHTAFRIAAKSAERLYAISMTEAGKTAEVEENTRIYQHMVQTCLRLTPPDWLESFVYAEEGRSRLFRDQLGMVALPAPRRAPKDWIARETELLRIIRNAAQALRTYWDETQHRQFVDAANEARDELQRLWDMLANEYDAADYVALRRGEKMKWEDFRQMLTA
jgi:tetratricopeptide (TPR) repeat protein